MLSCWTEEVLELSCLVVLVGEETRRLPRWTEEVLGSSRWAILEGEEALGVL